MRSSRGRPDEFSRTDGERPLCILSIDGGGIYELTAAMLLVEIERRTGRPIAELFDLVAGTSAGALLGVCHLVPDREGRPRYTAEEVLSLYEKDAHEVFETSVWHWLRVMGGLLGEKYEPTGVENALAEVFDDAWLSDSLRPTLIPAYDLGNDHPFLFRSHRARAHPAEDFTMRQVIRGASAVPGYFPPGLATSRAGREHSFIDGGVYAFSPALWAYLEAADLWDGGRGIVMLSVGTTRADHGLSYERVAGWGMAYWTRPLFELMCDANAAASHAQLRQIFATHARDGGYYRLEAHIDTSEVTALDDVSEAQLSRVRRAGEALIRSESGRLDELCRRLPGSTGMRLRQA